MKFGVVYPQTELPPDSKVVRDYVQRAEELGFNHILAYEHVVGASPERLGDWSPYTFEDPFMAPFPLFSYMAAVTQRIEFTTGILILPQRQTALVAKQAATLDILCGGRLRLGLGLGWNSVEYEALGENFHNRGARIEEQVELLRKLWTEKLVNYKGRWHEIVQVGVNPLPVQRPIPLWFGGHHDNVLRRVATMSDGWMPNYRSAAEAAPHLDKLDSYLEEAGRSRQDIGIEFRVYCKGGDADSWSQTISDWQAAGATHMSFNTMGAGFDSPAEHMVAIEKFASAIGSS